MAGFEVSPEVLFGRANGRYAQALNIRKGRTGHLWRARYHSCVMSEHHLWVGLRYVETNPCRAGIVESPEKYRWSSAGAHMLGQPDHSRILDLAFWQKAGGAATWSELYSTEGYGEQSAPFRKCTIRRPAIRR